MDIMFFYLFDHNGRGYTGSRSFTHRLFSCQVAQFHPAGPGGQASSHGFHDKGGLGGGASTLCHGP